MTAVEIIEAGEHQMHLHHRERLFQARIHGYGTDGHQVEWDLSKEIEEQAVVISPAAETDDEKERNIAYWRSQGWEWLIEKKYGRGTDR